MRVRYTPRAFADRERIFSYLVDRNPQAARRVVGLIARRIAELADQPRKGRRTDRGGIDCEVFEQADAVRELGVGINTLPHAIKELAELGLLPRLDDVGIRTFELIYTNRLGQEIWREPRGLDAGYDVPQFSIHRGRLQGVIYQAARARLGEKRFHMGHRLGSFRQDDAGVTAYFFDRAGSHRATAQGDV